MPKETKFTIALMLLLAVAFGFVVWQRVSKQGDVIAALKDKAKKIVGKEDSKDKKPADKKTPIVKKGGHQHDEPRKLPFDSRQTAQVSQNPFNDKAHNHNHHQPPGNPFAQNKTNVVAQKPPQNLFAEPVAKKEAPKPNPFTPWTSSDSKKHDHSHGSTVANNKTINALPASQSRTKVEPKKPLTPFQQHFPGQTRQEAPKPNPFAQGHDHSHSAAQQNIPFNPFEAKPMTNQQAGKASMKPQTPAPNNPFDPFKPVQQVKKNEQHSHAHPPVKQTAQQNTQQPFDPFGSVSTAPKDHQHEHSFDSFPAPKQSPRQTAPAPSFQHTTSHRQRHQHDSTPNPFGAPKQAPSPKQPTKPAVVNHGPTRVYTVKPDESYWSISKTVYGSIRYFQALEQHNRSRISSAKKLRPGMKVLVPEEKFLLASYSKLIPGAQKASGSPQSEQVAQGLYFTPSGHPMFRVGPEDTLSDIAHKHLGRTTRWVEIYNLNKDRVKTPDRLKIGTVLRLPADASRIALAPGTTIRR